jgi:hypothetical protein
MLSSRTDAFGLLAKLKEERTSLVALVHFSPKEKHEFRAVVERFSDDEIVLAGEFAVVSVPLMESSVFEYSDAREAPPDMRPVISAAMEYSIAIRSHNVRAVLFVERNLQVPQS